MAAETLVLPMSAYKVLRRLTGATRPDVALSLALKDLTRLKLQEAHSKAAEFERKYGMIFATFEQDWEAGKIPEAYSYTVEKDYWEWEAAESDIKVLEELAQWLV